MIPQIRLSPLKLTGRIRGRNRVLNSRSQNHTQKGSCVVFPIHSVLPKETYTSFLQLSLSLCWRKGYWKFHKIVFSFNMCEVHIATIPWEDSNAALWASRQEECLSTSSVGAFSALQCGGGPKPTRFMLKNFPSWYRMGVDLLETFSFKLREVKSWDHQIPPCGISLRSLVTYIPFKSILNTWTKKSTNIRKKMPG